MESRLSRRKTRSFGQASRRRVRPLNHRLSTAARWRAPRDAGGCCRKTRGRFRRTPHIQAPHRCQGSAAAAARPWRCRPTCAESRATTSARSPTTHHRRAPAAGGAPPGEVHRRRPSRRPGIGARWRRAPCSRCLFRQGRGARPADAQGWNGVTRAPASAPPQAAAAPAMHPSKPRRSTGRFRLRPMNTIFEARFSPVFQGPMKSPSASICTAWKAKRSSEPW